MLQLLPSLIPVIAVGKIRNLHLHQWQLCRGIQPLVNAHNLGGSVYGAVSVSKTPHVAILDSKLSQRFSQARIIVSKFVFEPRNGL